MKKMLMVVAMLGLSGVAGAQSAEWQIAEKSAYKIDAKSQETVSPWISGRVGDDILIVANRTVEYDSVQCKMYQNLGMSGQSLVIKVVKFTTKPDSFIRSTLYKDALPVTVLASNSMVCLLGKSGARYDDTYTLQIPNGATVSLMNGIKVKFGAAEDLTITPTISKQ